MSLSAALDSTTVPPRPIHPTRQSGLPRLVAPAGDIRVTGAGSFGPRPKPVVAVASWRERVRA